jgi:hypothetical protein
MRVAGAHDGNRQMVNILAAVLTDGASATAKPRRPRESKLAADTGSKLGAD